MLRFILTSHVTGTDVLHDSFPPEMQIRQSAYWFRFNWSLKKPPRSLYMLAEWSSSALLILDHFDDAEQETALSREGCLGRSALGRPSWGVRLALLGRCPAYSGRSVLRGGLPLVGSHWWAPTGGSPAGGSPAPESAAPKPAPRPNLRAAKKQLPTCCIMVSGGSSRCKPRGSLFRLLEEV